MVIVYVFASLLGAFATVAVLASYSWLWALLCAPLGGSALALVIAMGTYVQGAHRAPSHAKLVSPTP